MRKHGPFCAAKARQAAYELARLTSAGRKDMGTKCGMSACGSSRRGKAAFYSINKASKRPSCLQREAGP